MKKAKKSGFKAFSQSSSRKYPAKANQAEFTFLRKSHTVPKVKYMAKRKQKNASKKKWQKFFIITSWMVCAALVLHWVFADGGLADYYSMEKVLAAKKKEYHAIVSENKQIKNEIKQMKTNPKLQKKLVREHLGVISDDEYLILFAKEKASRSK